MTKEIGFALTAVIAILLLVLMFTSWRRRMRRDAALTAPLGVPEHAQARSRFEVLYVSTTRHDEPLERVTVRPLAYRARGELVITDRGAALALDGTPTVFLPTDRLVEVSRATVTIDRVVEPGGLIRLVWNVADDHPVDSYLRSTRGETADMIFELERLCGATPKTGASS